MGEEVIFSKAKHVVQVFVNEYVYGKDEKSFDLRKAKMAWRELSSRSGYVADGALYLPEAISGDAALASSGLIILQDFNEHASPMRLLPREQDYQCLRPRRGPVSVLGDLGIAFEEVISLHFMDAAWQVQVPRRNQMKLCHLVPDRPVELRYNYKWDSSMSSGRQRQYVDYVFVVVYLGLYGACRLLPPGAVCCKRVPEVVKVVDLWKPLW
jgi:hypothetical protein